MQEAGLAHSHVPYDDVFKDVRVIIRAGRHDGNLAEYATDICN